MTRLWRRLLPIAQSMTVCAAERADHGVCVGVLSFLSAIESAELEGVFVTYEGADPTCVTLAPAATSLVLELCAEHGLEVDSLSRISAFATDSADMVELALDEDGAHAGLTLNAAAVGLLVTAKGIVEGSVDPAVSLVDESRSRGFHWFYSGSFGAPPPVPPPQVEIFVRLFSDVWPGSVDDRSWEWAERVVDRAGLLMSAALLA